MARINIDDSIFTDTRFLKLVVHLGSMPAALGHLCHAWIVAQRYYLTESRMIPRTAWDAQELHGALIDVGLAEVVGDHVRMKGSDAQFAWLLQRSNAGRLGGAKPKASDRKRPLTTESGRLTDGSGSKPLSLSLSHKPKIKNLKSILTEHEKPKTGDAGLRPETAVAVSPVEAQEKFLIPEQPKAAGQGKAESAQWLIAAWIKAFQLRFPGQRPAELSDPKVIGQMRLFARTIENRDRVAELMQIFFQIEDDWFKKRGWAFETFRANLNRIGQARDAGEDVSGSGVNWAKLRAEFESRGEIE